MLVTFIPLPSLIFLPLLMRAPWSNPSPVPLPWLHTALFSLWDPKVLSRAASLRQVWAIHQSMGNSPMATSLLLLLQQPSNANSTNEMGLGLRILPLSRAEY